METVMPKSIGYADNADCWQARNATVGFLAFLESKGQEFCSWFAQADWVNDTQPGSHALPPQETVFPIQNYVNVETVERYRLTVDTFNSSNYEAWERYPTLFQWDGKIFIYQGTHRLAALYANNAKEYFGYMLNLDEMALGDS